MTPGTRLLEACRELVRLDGGGSTLGDVLGATYALKGVRALYSAAHAIGERVSVVYPPEMREKFATQHCKDFTGVITGVEFHTDGVDYRVTGEGDPDYTVVEAAFVHPAPEHSPGGYLEAVPYAVQGGPSSRGPFSRATLTNAVGEAAGPDARFHADPATVAGCSSGEPFDYDSLTDDEKSLLRKTPLYDRAKELGLVPPQTETIGLNNVSVGWMKR